MTSRAKVAANFEWAYPTSRSNDIKFLELKMLQVFGTHSRIKVHEQVTQETESQTPVTKEAAT
jgi:hypothetical protein